jgi:CRP-like cAMP-binding protein
VRRREISTQDLLANVPLFKQLTAASRARIAAHVTRLPLQRGDVVFHRGGTPTGFFIVVYGEIALTAHGVRGPRLTGLVVPGRSFGEPMMFLGKPYIVDARAQSDALLLFVPKDAIFAEIECNPAFAHRMIAGLAARIEALVREIDTHARGSARERVIDYLLRVGGRREGEVAVRIPTTKTALASQLGLSAEHLSRILHELARRKLVRIDGRRILITDIAALAAQGHASQLSQTAGDQLA